MFLVELYRAWRSSHRCPVRKRLKEVLRAYAMTFTFGWPLMAFMLTYVVCGKLKVVGHRNLLLALVRGKVIIAPNHPGVVESLFISIVLVWLFPIVAPIVWPYAMPDAKTFLPKRLWWIYPFLRCITVDRSDESHTKKGTDVAKKRLADGEVVVIHGEGGRTCKLPADQEYLLGAQGRRLRPLKPGVMTLALRIKGVRILPVWVEFNGPPIVTPERYRALLRRGLTIYFGEAYDPTQGLGPELGRIPRATTELARRILATGIEIE